MARLGLSPYSNPIESGVDTFAKLNSVFNERDRMKMEQQRLDNEQQDRQESRQLRSLQMQREQNALDEQEADKPLQAARRNAELTDYENKALTPEWESAERELMAAAKENRAPNLTAKQTAAVEIAAKRSQVPLDQIHTLMDHMQKFMPVIQGLPPGSKIRIDDQQHPETLAAFNAVYGKQMGGEAKSLFYDKDKNSFVVGMGAGGDDGEAGADKVADSSGKIVPLATKDGKYVQEIPGDKLFKDIVYHGMAAHMLEAARYNADPAYRKQVDAAELQFKTDAKQAHAVGEFQQWQKENPDAGINEQRIELRKLLLDSGAVSSKEVDAVVKTIVQPKTSKTAGHIVQDPKSPTGYSYLAEDGDNIPGAPEPSSVTASKDRAAAREQREHESKERKLDRQEARDKERREKADKDKEKRRDALVKEKLALLHKDPDWSGKEFAEQQDEAERQADAQIAGKPAPKAQGSSVKPLADFFKGKKGGMFGDDIESDVESAAGKWPEAQVREAARVSKNKDVQAAVEDYYRKHPGKPARSMAPQGQPKPAAKPTQPAKKTEGKRQSLSDFD